MYAYHKDLIMKAVMQSFLVKFIVRYRAKGADGMARRGENIFKRKDGRWEARYVSGKNEFGKTRYASVYGRSYREVKEKREKASSRQTQSETLKSPKCTFGEILDLSLIHI